MTTALPAGERLAQSPVCKHIRDHRFFHAVNSPDLTREQAALLVPPCVAVLPGIASKSAITRILNPVLAAADEMWRLWTAFFDRLALETDVTTAGGAW